jgi:putative acetyltransferase
MFDSLVRDEQPGDRAAVRLVNELAFGRSDEADLVEALHRESAAVVALVAETAGEVIGHILFSPVEVSVAAGKRFAGLAPMAVAPAFQGRGVGRLLVEAGLKGCAAMGFDAVVVLGRPRYYPRFGFAPSRRFGLYSEYDVAPEAFMALELPDRSIAGASGCVRYHSTFGNLRKGA